MEFLWQALCFIDGNLSAKSIVFKLETRVLAALAHILLVPPKRIWKENAAQGRSPPGNLPLSRFGVENGGVLAD